jgi:hypothetical protein
VRGDAIIGKSAVHLRLLVLTILAGMSVDSCRAQDLAPRAYVITPLHSNAITLTWSFFDGSIDLNGLPVSGTGTYSVPIFSYYHSFSFFNRSANVVASLPYAVGTSREQHPARGRTFTVPVFWIRSFASP